MRIKLLKASVVVALLAILLGMPLLLSGHRIFPERFTLIHLDMTESEIEDVLGAKAGRYDGYEPDMCPDLRQQPDPTILQEWCSRHGSIFVRFDQNGRAADCQIVGSRPATWWARLWEEYFPRRKTEFINFKF